MFWLEQLPENSVCPETRRLHLPLISLWILLDKYCPMLYFAMLLWPAVLNKSSSMPSCLLPLCPINQLLLSFSSKYYQICSPFSPSFHYFSQSHSHFAWTTTVSSLFQFYTPLIRIIVHSWTVWILHTGGWSRRLVGLKNRACIPVLWCGPLFIWREYLCNLHKGACHMILVA